MLGVFDLSEGLEPNEELIKELLYPNNIKTTSNLLRDLFEHRRNLMYETVSNENAGATPANSENQTV